MAAMGEPPRGRNSGAAEARAERSAASTPQHPPARSDPPWCLHRRRGICSSTSLVFEGRTWVCDCLFVRSSACLLACLLVCLFACLFACWFFYLVYLYPLAPTNSKGARAREQRMRTPPPPPPPPQQQQQEAKGRRRFFPKDFGYGTPKKIWQTHCFWHKWPADAYHTINTGWVQNTADPQNCSQSGLDCHAHPILVP